MRKIGNVNRWYSMQNDTAMELPGKHSRTVRLNVNSPGRARFYIIDQHGEERFLGTTEMLDGLEFHIDGPAKLVTPDEDVFVWSAEFEPTFSDQPDRTIFTRIANRAARNPDLEYLMHMQQVNIERRMAMLQQEMEAKYARPQAAAPSQAPKEPSGQQSAGDANAKPPVKGDSPDSAGSGGSAASDGAKDGANGDEGQSVPAKPDV